MRFSRTLYFTTPFILALSALPACSSPPSEVAIVEEKPLEITVNNQAFSNVLDTSFRGQYRYKDGQGYFKSCNDQQEYDVLKNQELAGVYQKITNNTLKPVYIEFAGEIDFPKNSGSKSSVVMRIDRIHHMALAKASLQCAKPIDNFNFKAKGNEPYWRINMQNNKLFFATKASNQSYTLEHANFQETKKNILKSSNAKGQPLSLEIAPGHCYMSDNKEYWGFTTKANSVHGTYLGCGEPGHLTTGQVFHGYYLSNAQQGQEINLALNANHTVEYKQNNNSGQRVKTGFWKSNTPNTLVVMFTKEGDQAIQEEIIFTRDGLTLSSNEINKSNVLMKFNTPLVFNQMDSKHGVLDNQQVRIEREFIAQRISPDNDIDAEVQTAVRAYFKMHRTDPNNTRFNSVRFDLNGDGKDEAIVMLDWCSKAGCEMLIFEAKDKGLRFSSRVSRVQAPILVAQSQHFSWQSLLTNNNKKWLLLDFDGLSYPLNTRGAKPVDRASNSTGVILFNKGKPTIWFPIK